MQWQTFEGKTVELVPWLGRRVAFLTQRADLDASVMAEILDALDRAWEWYRGITGGDPAPRCLQEGRTTIAEVEGIGGAAWAWLGETGIEIQPEYFDVLYRGVLERGEFDQPLFYELGRNFWLYRALDLEGAGSVCTGYAVFMRFRAMASIGVRGAPYRGVPFERFERATLSLLEHVRAPDWRTLLARDAARVATVDGLDLSTADLVASLLASWLPDDDKLRRFLRAAERVPPPRDVEALLANLRTCAIEAGATLPFTHDPKQFASYWHQIDLVLAHDPKRVLEIGGDGFLAAYLRRAGIDVTEIGSSAPLASFPDASFDVVTAFDAGWARVEPMLREMRRVSSRAVGISVIDAGRVLRVESSLN